MKTVYLCGRINGCDDAEAKGWRAVASAALLAGGFTVLDPMRRDFRGIECNHVKAIVCGDLFDIQMASILLVNASRPSWGAGMEIMHAARYEYRKTIIAFGAGDRPSPWLVYHCDKMFPDLESAISHILHR